MSTQAEDTRPMTAAEVERMIEEEEWYRRRMLVRGLIDGQREKLAARAKATGADVKAYTGCDWQAGDRVVCERHGPGVVVETWPSLWLADTWHFVVVRLDSTGEKLRTRSTDLTREQAAKVTGPAPES